MVLRYSGMIGMTILNPLCGLLAMQYLSPSICAPFSGLTIVWILILSGPIVQEYPTQLQIMSCIFLLISELLIAVFGDHTDGIATEDNQTNDPLATFNTVVSYLFVWISVSSTILISIILFRFLLVSFSLLSMKYYIIVQKVYVVLGSFVYKL